MNVADLLSCMELPRRKTLELLDAIAKRPEADKILGWRPGPGRAHIAWQAMHVAATDDRHLNVRMKGGEPREPEYVRRFAGGSVPDDEIPALDEIRRYLTESRQRFLDHIRTISDAQLNQKPNPEAPWTYQEWVQVLTWHESHHHGQAHLTLNLYRAQHDPKMEKVGH
ncbi:MAG: DinB family protein [Gemmataceae bacterium]|nr:DinB family protein [Gemmataceae bacterium]